MALNPKLLLVTIYVCLLVNKQMVVFSKPATGDIVVNNEININIEGKNGNKIDLSNVVIGQNDGKQTPRQQQGKMS